MSSLTPGAVTFDFDTDPAPTRKINDAQVDAQIALLWTRCNALLTIINGLTRSDDGLADGLVRLRGLHAEVTEAIASKSGWKPKAIATLATTADVALSGEQTIDGVLTSTSRVLVKDQVLKSQNGLYTTSAGAWVRTTDTDTAAEIALAFVSVLSGTINGRKTWVNCQEAANITLGTTSLDFTPVGMIGTLPISEGGTGATTAAAARTAIGIVERTGSATFDPSSLADGAGQSTTVTVTGAVLGDYVVGVSFSLSTQGITITAAVTAADTVTVRFQNETGGTIDLASGTLRVLVRSYQ